MALTAGDSQLVRTILQDLLAVVKKDLLAAIKKVLKVP
jgi:hypothetical protein